MSMENMFNGMFGKIAPGMCRLSMNGDIAIKTDNGYKTYNMKTGRLINCSNFVFDIGQDFFFVIPTNKVSKGDIILVNGKPRCVVEVETSTIKVINYNDSTVESILPERHMFMGNTYFYGKIVSMFGSDLFKDKKKGANNIMKYMMVSEMMKGSNPSIGGDMNPMLAMAMASGNMGSMFEGMFDFGDSGEESDDSESGSEE